MCVSTERPSSYRAQTVIEPPRLLWRSFTLVIPGASGVAVPVSKDWTSEDLRDLVSAKTIRNLSEALGEPEPL